MRAKVCASYTYLRGVAVMAISLALAACDRGEATSMALVPPAGASFSCRPAMVWDGDSFTCSDGRKVRVSGIAAREVRWDGSALLDAGCRDGHPCPTADGVAARNGLVRLLGDARGKAGTGHVLIDGPELRCVSTGSAGGERVGAWCRSPMSGDLSCAMVRAGHAVRWPRYWRDHRC
jgi:endonuclease YncB( thermonuclease family)